MKRTFAHRIAFLALTLTVSTALPAAPAFAQGTDRDLDNDGTWDFDRGGTDRDMDNDEVWDFKRGGTDRDLDNDDVWDDDAGGTDHDRDNDEVWDY